MKRTIQMFAMLGLMLAVSGCLTSITAETKKTAVDGSVTLAKVRVFGTGDKVAQSAAEGLFADGTDEDLGAGVKKASAKQESSGIEGSLKGMGDFMGGVAQFMLAVKELQDPTPTVKKPVVVDQDTESAEVDTSSPPPTASETTPKSVVSAEGAPTVAILGNRVTCSLCRTLWSELNATTLSESLCGASVIDADKTANSAEYARLRPKGAFKYPLVMVFDSDDKLVGQFSGAGMTQAAMASKVQALIPSCAAK